MATGIFAVFGIENILLLFHGVSAAKLFTQQPKPDSIRKRTGWTGYPFIFYSPETKTGGGGAINFFFREAGSGMNVRPSSLMPVLVYTQKQQVSATFFADLYWKREKKHLIGMVSYSNWPNQFYGIGNNTSNDAEDYTQRAIALDLRFLRQVRRGMYLGVQYQFLRSRLVEVEAGGQLARGDVLGSNDGTASGIGALVSWDTRDNIFYASSGNFYQLSARVFHDRLNSDMEYRLPVWKRFGAVGFAGLGEVAPEIGDFELKSFKHSFGAGLRYLLVPAEKLNMRMDFGWSKDSSGFYLALTEAF